MPSYDYRCSATDQVYEVCHSMHEKLSSWGELCKAAGLELGDIPANTPVERLISGGGVVTSSALRNPEGPACEAGMSCCGGPCGLP